MAIREGEGAFLEGTDTHASRNIFLSRAAGAGEFLGGWAVAALGGGTPITLLGLALAGDGVVRMASPDGSGVIGSTIATIKSELGKSK